MTYIFRPLSDSDTFNSQDGHSIALRRPQASGSKRDVSTGILERGFSLADYTSIDGATDNLPGLTQCAADAAAAGGHVFIPNTPSAVVIRSGVFVPPPGLRLLRNENPGQVWVKDQTNDLISMSTGFSFEGGVLLGASKPGRCFAFPPNTGRQRIHNVNASQGWVDPIVYYALMGGSQSVIRASLLSRDNAPNNAPQPNYAIVVEDASPTAIGAYPRRVVDCDFNGTPSIFFGGCSSFFVVGCYIADLGFSINSRAVRLTASRIGNQTSMVIYGANHSIDADMLPRILLAPGTDNCTIGGSYNSGFVIDSSGNSRNCLNYWQHSVTCQVTSDVSPLALTNAYCTIGRASAAYHFQFYFTLQNFGPGITYITLPPGTYTSCPVDQYGTATLMYTDGSGVVQRQAVFLRLLPYDGTTPGNRIEVLNPAGPVSQSNPAGWTNVTLVGSMDYSA